MVMMDDCSPSSTYLDRRFAEHAPQQPMQASSTRKEVPTVQIRTNGTAWPFMRSRAGAYISKYCTKAGKKREAKSVRPGFAVDL